MLREWRRVRMVVMRWRAMRAKGTIAAINGAQMWIGQPMFVSVDSQSLYTTETHVSEIYPDSSRPDVSGKHQ